MTDKQTTGEKIVALASCESYGRKQVYDQVKLAIDLIGGIGKYVSPGMRVLLKPNMLMGSSSENAVTTHPDVVYAVAKILKDHGCSVIIADSPGAGIVYNERNLRKAYEASGFDTVADDTGAELNYDTGYKNIAFPEGKMMKQFPIINPATEADAIVVVSKVKTHMFTYISAAVKNLFGVVPGLEKPVFHARFQNADDFGAMLVDLNELVKPDLHVIDAVTGMEGNGPMSGTPRHIGAILAGSDSNALDVVVSRLVAIDPYRIGTIKSAIERGLLTMETDEITIRGGDVNDFIVADYLKPSSYQPGHKNTFIQNITLKIMQKYGRAYALRPVAVRGACVGCGQCVRICPVNAIELKECEPVFDLNKCIRCYCCHEMCDSHAIGLERGLSGRLMKKIIG